jgi:cation transport protein ChaC
MNAPLPRLSLSRDLIAAAFRDPVADDEAAQPELASDAVDAMMDQALRHLGPHDDVWLFAYGSLMWAPEPELEGAETRLATLRGWHRRFCLWQWRYRGSRENPALVLALDRGGACRGLLFRVSGPDQREKLTGVFRRELRGDGYRPRWVGLEVDGAPLSALTFVVNRASRRYTGRLADEFAAAHIAAACGPKGPSAVYLLETAARCAALGIEDAMLDRLQALVASEIARRLAETAIPASASPSRS